MQRLDARLASFEAVTKPKKSAKVGFPLSDATHPRLTPELLARAGFYHAPGKAVDTHDTCKCFMCDLELGGWDEDDDPFVEHLKREGSCGWKEVVCRIEVDEVSTGEGRGRLVYETLDALPNSTKNTAFREKTFGDWWPHKVPSVRSGKPRATKSTAAPKKGRATKATVPEPEAMDVEEQEEPAPAPKRRGRPPKVSTAASSLAASTNGKEPEAEVVEAEEPAPAPKRRGRQPKASTASTSLAASTRGKASEQAEPEPEVVEVEEPAPAPKRRGRPPKASTAASLAASTAKAPASKARGKAAAANDDEIEVESQPEPVKKTRAKRATTSKATASAAVSPVKPIAADDDLELPTEAEVEAALAPKPKGKGGRPKKSTAAAATVEESVPADTPRATKPLPRKSRVTKKTETQGEEQAEPVSEPARSRIPAPTKTPRSAPAAPPLSQLERFVNTALPPTPPPKSAARAQPSAVPSPSVRQAVEAIVSGQPVTAPAAPSSSGFSEAEKKKTVEEFIREQFTAHHAKMKTAGEATISKFEASARDARRRIEQV
ncbi:hypothetical protein Q8F55_006666 [Vanrija albida]|uniref:BIR-domain-containing protein n=1 Tax=Vanrija albida TaxID=181172 RepID=A0ABR3PXU1_9TREE